MTRTDWIQTATGKAFWPLTPLASEVHAEDIAHSLAMQCRFGGHCLRFYSVAEHSVLMARMVSKPLKLWALLHDAAEAYLVDVPRPLKPHLQGYAEAEARIMRVICERFGLQPDMPAPIARADLAMLMAEKQQNMAAPPMGWSTDCDPMPIRLRFWSPARAKVEFLRSLHNYSDKPDVKR